MSRALHKILSICILAKNEYFLTEGALVEKHWAGRFFELAEGCLVRGSNCDSF